MTEKQKINPKGVRSDLPAPVERKEWLRLRVYEYFYVIESYLRLGHYVPNEWIDDLGELLQEFYFEM